MKEGEKNLLLVVKIIVLNPRGHGENKMDQTLHLLTHLAEAFIETNSQQRGWYT